MHQANYTIIFRKFCHWRIHLHHLPKIISLAHFGLSSNSGPRLRGHSMFGMSNFVTTYDLPRRLRHAVPKLISILKGVPKFIPSELR